MEQTGNRKADPQTAREPVEAEIEGGGWNWWYVCGECHGAIDPNEQYCRHCGCPIIWPSLLPQNCIK